MGSPHPLLHMGFFLYCSNDTRSGEGFGWGALRLSLLPFPTSGLKSVQLPDVFALGSFLCGNAAQL